MKNGHSKGLRRDSVLSRAIGIGCVGLILFACLLAAKKIWPWDVNGICTWIASIPKIDFLGITKDQYPTFCGLYFDTYLYFLLPLCVSAFVLSMVFVFSDNINQTRETNWNHYPLSLMVFIVLVVFPPLSHELILFYETPNKYDYDFKVTLRPEDSQEYKQKMYNFRKIIRPDDSQEDKRTLMEFIKINSKKYDIKKSAFYQIRSAPARNNWWEIRSYDKYENFSHAVLVPENSAVRDAFYRLQEASLLDGGVCSQSRGLAVYDNCRDKKILLQESNKNFQYVVGFYDRIYSMRSAVLGIDLAILGFIAAGIRSYAEYLEKNALCARVFHRKNRKNDPCTDLAFSLLESEIIESGDPFYERISPLLDGFIASQLVEEEKNKTPLIIRISPENNSDVIVHTPDGVSLGLLSPSIRKEALRKISNCTAERIDVVPKDGYWMAYNLVACEDGGKKNEWDIQDRGDFLFSQALSERFHPSWWRKFVWQRWHVALPTMWFLLLSIFCAYQSFWPILEGGNKSLLLFQKIQNMEPERYLKSAESQSFDFRVRDTILQTWRHAKIVYDKYILVQKAMMYMFFSFFPGSVMMFHLFLKRD